ncbi:MAG: YciI family protein [Pseudomonadota bacterium]
MLFALICTDKPNHVHVRQEARPAHVRFLEGLGDQLKAAGPFVNDEDIPVGSLVIIEAENRAAAEAISAQDPYAEVGLFDTVEIRPWKWLIKPPSE